MAGRFSLALNIGLAAGVAWWLIPPPPETAPATRPQAVGRPSALATHLAPPEDPFVVHQTNRFHWSMAASTDYTAYAANLRALGAPPTVVSDIIVSAVNQNFARQRHALYLPCHARFWELLALGSETEFNEMDEQVNALRDTRRDTLKAALGADWEQQRKSPADDPRHRLQLGFLPDETRRQLQQLDEQYQARRAETRRAYPPQSRELTALLRELEKEHDATLRALLSSEEYDEYRFRTNPEAQWAQNLPGFDGTEEEFRALGGLRREVPSAQTNEFNAQARSLLGEERFLLLQRSCDPRFQEIYHQVSRSQSPPETAVSVYQLRLIAEEQADLIRTSSALSPDQRAAVLDQIQEETREALRQALGDQADSYLDEGAGWLGKLVGP